MSTVGLQLLLFTLPLDLLINDVCTSLLELKFSRLIVLMVGYLPLWELISSSSARLRAAVRAVRSHHRPGQVRVRVVAHRHGPRVHVVRQRLQTHADALLARLVPDQSKTQAFEEKAKADHHYQRQPPQPWCHCASSASSWSWLPPPRTCGAP